MNFMLEWMVTNKKYFSAKIEWFEHLGIIFMFYKAPNFTKIK